MKTLKINSLIKTYSRDVLETVYFTQLFNGELIDLVVK